MEVALNWWAIIGTMVASVVLGFLWYGPLFGKAWMRETGIKMPEDGQRPSMAKPVIISLIGAFFLAYALNHGLVFGNAYLNMSGAVSGLMGAFWYWLGFVVPVMLSFVAWEGKSWKLFCIQAGYWLALILVSGLLITTI
jgi:hypothetical protein